MHDNSYYTQEQHGPYESYAFGDFKLHSGETLLDAQLAYSLHGELNAERDNAVLFAIMFSGTSKNMEHYIGAGKALDPEKYCIILPNQLGNGLSTSPNNAHKDQRNRHFPRLSITDDVTAQYQMLTRHLGVKRLRLVTGWSMGAQQTYEWIVRYPEFVEVAVPIGGTARCTPHCHHFVNVFCQALQSDPGWKGGTYGCAADCADGLRRLARIFALLGFSPQFYRMSQWERLGFESMEALMKDFWEAWFAPMDPNVLITLAHKWQDGDVSRKFDGNLQAALANVKAKTHIVAFERDMFVPVDDCRTDQQAIANSRLHVVPSLMGHFAMLGLWQEDYQAVDDILREALD